MSGFRNCPSITKFAVGMVITCDRSLLTVVRTYSNEAAVAATPVCLETRTLTSSDIEGCTLDLSSIWVGRKYRDRHQHNVTAEVLMTDAALVCFADQTIMRRTWSRANFLDQYEPLPLEEKQTVQPWTPKPGEKCWCGTDEDEFEFTPLYVGPIDSYGHAAHVPNEIQGRIVQNKKLHAPLPPEPPVKVGDRVLIARGAEEKKIAGTVAHVYPDRKEFHLAGWGVFCWDGLTITHLVPAPK
jgi:hypothetical protein